MQGVHGECGDRFGEQRSASVGRGASPLPNPGHGHQQRAAEGSRQQHRAPVTSVAEGLGGSDHTGDPGLQWHDLVASADQLGDRGEVWRNQKIGVRSRRQRRERQNQIA
jgi:hypothetical protein